MSPYRGLLARLRLWIDDRFHNLFDLGVRLWARNQDRLYRSWFEPRAASLRDYLACFALGSLLGTLVLARLVFSSDYFSGSGTDAISQYFPLRDFAFSWLRRGVVPLWNPYIFNGLPMQTGLRPILYVGNVLGLFIKDAGLEIKLNFWLHLLLAINGMSATLLSWRLSRASALVGGLSYGLGGFIAGHLFAGHMDTVATAAWAPWVLWAALAALRRSGLGWTLLAACMVALMVNAAQYQAIYLTLWTTMGLTLLCCLLGQRFAVPALNWRAPWSQDQGERGKGQLHEILAPGVGWPERRRDLLGWTMRWAIMGVVSGLLMAFQVMPTLECLHYSNRSNIGWDFASSMGAPTLNWLVYLVPHMFMNTMDCGAWCDWIPWEGQAYLGIVGLLLIGVALLSFPRSNWLPLILLAVPASLIAMGKSTPIYWLYYHIDPMVRLFRVPSRFLLPVCLLGAWLVGLGMQAVLSGRHRRQVMAATGVLLGTLSLIWLVMFYSQPRLGGLWSQFVRYAASDDTWRHMRLHQEADDFVRLYIAVWMRLSLSIVLLLAAAYLALRSRGRWLATLLLPLMALDMGLFIQNFLDMQPKEKFWLPTPIIQMFGQEAFTQRVMTSVDLGLHDRFAFYQIADVGGYEAFANPTYTSAINDAFGWPDQMFTSLLVFDKNPFLDIQGARFAITNMPLSAMHEDTKERCSHYHLMEGSTPEIHIYENPDAFPRAFVAHDVIGVGDETEAIHQTVSQPGLIRNTAIMEMDERKRWLASVASTGWNAPTVPINTQDDALFDLDISPNVVSMNVKSTLPGMLILTDAWWPGWHASVDDAPAVVWKVNGGLHRGVWLKAGTHKVVFRYFPDSLRRGLMISVPSWSLLGLFLVGSGWASRKRSRKAGAASR